MKQLAGVALLTGACTIWSAEEASAQGFISPLIGYNFSGDSGCPGITNCEDKHLNWGVGFGFLGSIVGFEGEWAYIDDFFGETATSKSSVTTFMGNFLLAPKFGPVQPYGLIGAGLMKTKVDSTPPLITDTDQNDFGWDVGGGLMIFFGSHVGIRGDVRYFHSVALLNVFGIETDTKLDFGRASGAVVFKF
jgi:opacity protein-like surface antigen